MLKKRLVFVYSIPRESAFGLHDWSWDSSGVKMKKTKVGRSSDTIMALYSPKLGGLANYISYAPWVEEGVQKKDAQGNNLTLQDKMEQKWNRPKGYFTNKPWMKGDSLKDEDLTFFQKFSWKLNDGSTVFDLDTMEGELGYYVLLASSRCANSEKEWRNNMWPKASHYIAIENEAEEIKNKRNSVKLKAFKKLADDELTDQIKRKVISLLDIASTTATLSGEQIANNLFTFIESSTFTPNSNIDKFLEIVNLLDTADGRQEFEARYILKQALDCKVVTEKRGTYTFLSPKGPIDIGQRYQEAIEFILDPKKSVEVEDMLELIKAKN